MHPRPHLASALLALLLSPLPAHAIDRVITHSGYLLGANDLPVDGDVPFVFALYDAPENGTELWSSGAACTIPVRAGYYTARLGVADGCGSAIPAAIFASNATAWLSVQVDGMLLAPRSTIATGIADGVDDGFTQVAANGGLDATGGVLRVANGGVTNAMLANAAVTVTAGTGLSGGGAVALGDSISLSNTGVLSVSASGVLTASAGQNPTISLTAPTAAGQYVRATGAGAWAVGTIQPTDLPSLSSTYVALTGAQNIAGNKTLSGDLLLGTGTAASPLHVNRYVAVAGGWSRNATLEAPHPMLHFASGNSGKHAFIGQDGAAATDGLHFFVNGPSNDLAGATDALVLRGSGKVGIGTATPAEQLEVNGKVKAVQFVGSGAGLTNLPSMTTAIHGRYIKLYDQGPDNTAPINPLITICGTRGNVVGCAYFQMVSAYHCDYCYHANAAPQAVIYQSGNLPYTFKTNGAGVYMETDSADNFFRITSSFAISPTVVASIPSPAEVVQKLNP